MEQVNCFKEVSNSSRFPHLDSPDLHFLLVLQDLVDNPVLVLMVVDRERARAKDRLSKLLERIWERNQDVDPEEADWPHPR